MLVAKVRFPKTHDLTALLKLLSPLEPEWELMREHLTCLTDYAVRFRYPGSNASREQAREAVRIASLVRTGVLEAFGTSGRQKTKRRNRRH
ncbi:MAG: HEPN domain-containing protein [Phycisphaerales bacterium]|nr:HEPN domain-containing protein [Phycisphaerales bacterium]